MSLVRWGGGSVGAVCDGVREQQTNKKKIADAWLHKQINVLLNLKKKKPEKSFTDFLKSYLLACVLHKIILKKIKAETLGTSSQPSLKLTETNI